MEAGSNMRRSLTLSIAALSLLVALLAGHQWPGRDSAAQGHATPTALSTTGGTPGPTVTHRLPFERGTLPPESWWLVTLTPAFPPQTAVPMTPIPYP